MIDGRSSMPMLGASLPPVLMAAIAFALLSGGGGESRRQVETVAALAQAGTATATPAAAKAEATPSSGGEVALTAAALDVALSTSLTAQTVDAYLADAGCKAGAAAVVTAAARPPAAAWQASGTEVPCSLSAVIVTLADYEDSNSRWQSDRSLATVQSAMGAAGYTLERFFLPGAGSDANVKRGGDARRDPGVLLFRRLSKQPQAAQRSRCWSSSRCRRCRRPASSACRC